MPPLARASIAELPPRARRIPRCLKIIALAVVNYLRVRGEYPMISEKAFSLPELPPRARRILADGVQQAPVVGTTSACAENTRRVAHNQTAGGNYLRVRGEY